MTSLSQDIHKFIIPKSALKEVYPAEEIPKRGRKMDWMITDTKVSHKFAEKSLPIDESLMELDDLITKIVHNGKEQEMIKLLREYLGSIESKKYY